jgi:hypothetical protein
MPQAPSDFASANQTNIDVGTITFTPLPTLNSYAGAPQSGYVQIVTIGTNDPNASTGTISILNTSLTYSKETQYGSYYYAGNALSLNINGKAPQLFFVLYGASSASGFAGQAEMYSSFLTNSGLFSCTQVQALTSNN